MNKTLIFNLIAIGLCTGLLIKNNNTYFRIMVVSNAIHLYNLHRLDCGIQNRNELLSYDEIIDYQKLLLNIINWRGYETLVRPDVYEKIKPFIPEAIKNTRLKVR